MAPLWLDELAARTYGAQPARPEVVLREYPVRLGIRQEERTIAVMREMQLITLDAGHGSSSVPAQLAEFAEQVSGRFGAALAAPRAELERAHEAGEQHTEIRYRLWAESPELMLSYARLMEAADAYCAEGQLISLAPDADVYALRRWTVEEFLRQYDGAAPRPWSEVS